MYPRVSLAVPVYNGANYLAAALRSLLLQTFTDIDIIISDNASTDATPEICRRFAAEDERIRYHRLPINIGAGPNFNHAFRLARGEFFKWCAHDDLISLDFIERCVEALDSRPDAALAFGRTVCIDENENPVAWNERGFMPALEQDDPELRLGTAIRRAGNCFPVFGLFRTEALKRSTLHKSYYGSDRALIAEVALMGKAILVDEAVFYSRDHASRSVMLKGNAERRRWQTTSKQRWQSLEHFNLLVHLIQIVRRHSDVVRPSAAVREISKSLLTPKQLGRYGLDAVRLISPAAGEKLRKLRSSVLRSNRRMRLDDGDRKSDCLAAPHHAEGESVPTEGQWGAGA